MSPLPSLASLPTPSPEPEQGAQDPLSPDFATSTLVRLYLAQGHVDKARALTQRLCAQDPLDGQALALRKRSEQSLTCSLFSRVVQGHLILRWDLKALPADLEGAFVHIHLFDASAKRAEPEARRIRCDAIKGRRSIPLNLTQGACVTYLGLEAPCGATPRIFAVGPVHRWRHDKELSRTRM